MLGDSISFLLAFLLLFVFIKMAIVIAVMIENPPFSLVTGGIGGISMAVMVFVAVGILPFC